MPTGKKCHFGVCGGDGKHKIRFEGKKITVCDTHKNPAPRKRPKK